MEKIRKHGESCWVLGSQARVGSCPERCGGEGEVGALPGRSAAGPGLPQLSPAPPHRSQAPGTEKGRARLGDPRHPPWAAGDKIYGLAEQMCPEPGSVPEPVSGGSGLQRVAPLF